MPRSIGGDREFVRAQKNYEARFRLLKTNGYTSFLTFCRDGAQQCRAPTVDYTRLSADGAEEIG
jgi:hypothetical protein